jgi:hypothetical protein
MCGAETQYLTESGTGMPGREQKWKIGDDPDQQKKSLSHRGCRSRPQWRRHQSRERVFRRSRPQNWRGRGPRHRFLAQARTGRARQVLSSFGSDPSHIGGLDATSGGNRAFCEDLPVREELQQQRANTALPVTMDWSWRRSHNQVPMLIGLDAIGELGKLGVSEDLGPARKVRLGLCGQVRQLDRNRHGKTLLISLLVARTFTAVKKQSGINGFLPALRAGPCHLFRLHLDLRSAF